MNATTTTTAIFNAAKQYRDAGISFIPLRYVKNDVAASKAPASDALKAVGSWEWGKNENGEDYQKATWKPYQNRLPDDRELSTWFGNGKTRNIAILLGNVSRNLVAVDFDSEDAYNAWTADYPDVAKKTAIQKTGKGFHVLFRLPESIRNGKFSYAGRDENDIKCEGGYIVAWPSVHGSGRRYDWLPGQAPWEIGVMSINSLSEIGIDYRADNEPKNDPAPLLPPPQPQADSYNPLNVLKTISSIPDPEIRKRMLEAAESILVKTNSDTPPKSIKVLSADSILSTEWQAPRWAIPDYLPVGLTILAGKPKLGKSWLALQSAQAVAAGGKIFDRDVEQGSVLYLALEDTPRRLQDRMRKQSWPPGLPVDFLTLGDFETQIGSFAGGGAETLAGLIQERGYRMVIIDTLARALRSNRIRDSRSSVEMTDALAPIQEMAHACNCAVIMVDHMRKMGSADPDVISDIMDSISKGGVSDTAWGLYRERGKAEAKLQITGRDVDEVTLAIKMDWLTASWQSEGDYQILKMTERRLEILASVDALGPSATAANIAKAVAQDRGNTFKRLQEMAGAGLLRQNTLNGEVIYARP